MNTRRPETFSSDGYQLIDFGEGRKLESFAGWVVDRPSPAAEANRKSKPMLWKRAASSFDTVSRRWTHREGQPSGLTIDCGGFSMPVGPTPFGHVGLFPEQMPNWQWLRQTSPVRSQSENAEQLQNRPSGLNLFAYTGASSMAMASSGLAVAHVDAAKPNVSAAKQSAALNGLSDHPIRYLVDDALKFAAREVRRQNRYHTVVMDPPAYGHSPGGKAWRLERDLWPLIDACLRLVDPESFRILITGHSHQVGADDVLDYVADRAIESLGVSSSAFDSGVESGRLAIVDSSARKLDAGFFVRLNHSSTTK